MKISEIIVESDAGDVAALSAKNVSTGYNAVKKLFTPSQWFNKDVKVPNEPDTEKPNVSKVSSKPHLDKESVITAAQGKGLQLDDQKRLIVLSKQVQSGKIKTGSIDTQMLSQALKAAGQGQQIDKQQQRLLMQFGQQL